MFFALFFLFVLSNACNNSYTVIGGQHRWAPAYLAACHHIYTVSQKTVPTYFCSLSVKYEPISIKIGRSVPE